MGTKPNVTRNRSVPSAPPEQNKIEIPVPKKPEDDRDDALRYPGKKKIKKDFSNEMKTVILSCSDIESLSQITIPPTVEILELGYNQFTSLNEIFERKLFNLKYLGMTYNLIKSLPSTEKSLQRIFPNLLHLDLSYNDLDNLVNLIALVKTICNLRILMLSGNPCSLVSGYRGYVITNCQHVVNLDEISIYRKETQMYMNWMLKGGKFEAVSASIKVNVIELSIKAFTHPETKILPPKSTTVMRAPVKQEPKRIASYYIKYTWQMTDQGVSTVPKKSIGSSTTKLTTVEVLPTTSYLGSTVDSATSKPPFPPVKVYEYSTPPLLWADPIEFNDVNFIPTKNSRALKRFLTNSLVVYIMDDSMGVRAEFRIPLAELIDQPEINVNWTNVKKLKSQENVFESMGTKYITVNDGNQGKTTTTNPISCKMVVSIHRQVCE